MSTMSIASAEKQNTPKQKTCRTEREEEGSKSVGEREIGVGDRRGREEWDVTWSLPHARGGALF